VLPTIDSGCYTCYGMTWFRLGEVHVGLVHYKFPNSGQGGQRLADGGCVRDSMLLFRRRIIECDFYDVYRSTSPNDGCELGVDR